MKHLIRILIFIFAIVDSSSGQTKITTYKNKSGNSVGYSKQVGNKIIYYDKSHNKTGSLKNTNGNTTYYNRQGNKVGTSKTK